MLGKFLGSYENVGTVISLVVNCTVFAFFSFPSCYPQNGTNAILYIKLVMQYGIVSPVIK